MGNHLVGAPVPYRGYGQTEHDAGPRQTAVFVRAEEMHGVGRGFAAFGIGIVGFIERVVKVELGGVGVGQEVFVNQFFVAPNFSKA